MPRRSCSARTCGTSSPSGLSSPPDGPPSAAGTIAVGDTLAGRLKLHPGSSLVVAGHRLTVSGSLPLGDPLRGRGRLWWRLRSAQALSGLAGEATSIAVELAPGSSAANARRSLERQFQGHEGDRGPGRGGAGGGQRRSDPQRDVRDRDHRDRARRDQRHQHDGDVRARAPGGARAAQHGRLE